MVETSKMNANPSKQIFNDTSGARFHDVMKIYDVLNGFVITSLIFSKKEFSIGYSSTPYLNDKVFYSIYLKSGNDSNYSIHVTMFEHEESIKISIYPYLLNIMINVIESLANKYTVELISKTPNHYFFEFANYEHFRVFYKDLSKILGDVI